MEILLNLLYTKFKVKYIGIICLAEEFIIFCLALKYEIFCSHLLLALKYAFFYRGTKTLLERSA